MIENAIETQRHFTIYFFPPAYGKMLECPRKRQKIAFVTKKPTYDRLVKKESFLGRKIIDESCVLVKNRQTKVRFEKPPFIGYRVYFSSFYPTIYVLFTFYSTILLQFTQNFGLGLFEMRDLQFHSPLVEPTLRTKWISRSRSLLWHGWLHWIELNWIK